jgi:hypothetical protein
MGLEKTGRVTFAANRQQLQAFIAAADELGYPSVGTAALVSFEFLLREVDIVERFSWSMWRPAERPDTVNLRHHKNRRGDENTYLPLFDGETPLFPELTQRLDSAPKRGVFVVLTEGKRGDVHKPYERTYFAQVVRKIREKAGLPRALTFTSFRHGGITEIGDANVSDQGALSLTGHKSRDILSVYMKKTEKQRTTAARTRLEFRASARQTA